MQRNTTSRQEKNLVPEIGIMFFAEDHTYHYSDSEALGMDMHKYVRGTKSNSTKIIVKLSKISKLFKTPVYSSTTPL